MRNLSYDETALVSGGLPPIEDPGGDGGGGGGNPVVWWEDTNGNGIPDGRFTDFNGDGYLGVGDRVDWDEDAFIYEQTVNEYTADVFQEGFQNWASDFGWEVAVTGGSLVSGLDNAGRGLLVTFVASAHELLIDTFGSVDFGTMSRLGADYYSEAFDTYNPYEDPDSYYYDYHWWMDDS